MRFTLEIKMDNAAFEDNPAEEVASILRNVSAKLNRDGCDLGDDYGLRDSNGNTVGRWEVTA